MPKRCSGSVKITSVPRAELEAALRRWAETIGPERPEILRIGYFGSYAHGDHTPASDLDVVVLLGECDRPMLQRMLDYLPDGVPVGCEVFPYTADEVDRMRRDGRGWWREIETNAVWVWVRQ